MTLDPASKSAIRERITFYRELGVGPLYRRAVDAGLQSQDLGEVLVDELSAVTDEISAYQENVAQESYLATSENREDALRVILDDIGPNCQRCKLGKLGRKQVVFGTGDPHAELMFVGEGPGADEDAQGVPFVGRAGQLLNNMIAAMGLKREQVYIANIVKCRPPGNRTPERDECDTCSPFLMRQIEVVKPKVIVALGAVAAKNLLAINDSMANLRGRWYDFRGSKLLVTYHPAYLLRDPRQKKEAWKDLQMAMKYLELKGPAKAARD